MGEAGRRDGIKGGGGKRTNSRVPHAHRVPSTLRQALAIMSLLTSNKPF